MKHSFYFNFIIFVIISTIINSKSTFAQSNEVAKNVLDYFLELPNEYFVCEMAKIYNKAERNTLIKHKNVKNGFIKAEADIGNIEVALFKDKIKNRDILAVFAQCGPGCMCQKTGFLVQNTNLTWQNITDEIFPSEAQISKFIFNDENRDIFYKFIIPEFGTTIKVLEWDTEEHLCNLKWESGKFMLKKKDAQ